MGYEYRMHPVQDFIVFFNLQVHFAIKNDNCCVLLLYLIFVLRFMPLNPLHGRTEHLNLKLFPLNQHFLFDAGNSSRTGLLPEILCYNILLVVFYFMKYIFCLFYVTFNF